MRWCIVVRVMNPGAQGIYFSEHFEADEAELAEAKQTLETVVKDPGHLSFKDSDGNFVYFPGEVLRRSVLSLEKRPRMEEEE